MTDLSDLLTPEAVLCDMPAASKKGLFQQLGTLAAGAYGLDAATVTRSLAARERLSTTGFGGGVAIPHGKIEGLRRVVGLCVRIEQPIDFASVDDLPVDLVFALLSPVGAGAAHLKALARVSRSLRDQEFAEKLRGAGSTDALYALLTGLEARDAA